MMNERLMLAILLLGTTTACGEKQSSPQQSSMNGTKEAVPVADHRFNSDLPLKLVMEHVVTPAAFGVWDADGFEVTKDGIRDFRPKSEADWERIVDHAATLRETANLLRIPDRVLDDKWLGHVATFERAAIKAFDAAEARKIGDLAKAGDELVKVCDDCHENYDIQGKPNPAARAK